MAWTSASVDGRAQRVTNLAVKPNGPLKLIVLPPVALNGVYVAITDIAAGAKPLRQQVLMRKGSFMMKQKIDIEIPALPHEGFYRIEVTGTPDVGSVTTPPFLIYNSK